MTQGKIERYHRSMKNRILLDNYYLPGQLEQSIEGFVSYYNNCRYHESLGNLTPANVYFGRGQTIIIEREIVHAFSRYGETVASMPVKEIMRYGGLHIPF